MQEEFIDLCLGMIAALKIGGNTDAETIALMEALMAYVLTHDAAA